ncbi:hypothetical protein [Ekhidna sp.]|uniref:hypothetical protein n=1 Tax=Ekhidna sp. TaxID=2608089 RepID=UPI003C7E7B18
MNKQIEDLIDEALKTEPSFQLRKDFKDRVLQVIKRKEKASQRRLYLWMALGTLVIFGFGYATIAYFMPTVLESFGGVTNTLEQIIPLGILAGVIIFAIQYLDKKLVKDRMLHI